MRAPVSARGQLGRSSKSLERGERERGADRRRDRRIERTRERLCGGRERGALEPERREVGPLDEGLWRWPLEPRRLRSALGHVTRIEQDAVARERLGALGREEEARMVALA
jgi:hypothetical protein